MLTAYRWLGRRDISGLPDVAEWRESWRREMWDTAMKGRGRSLLLRDLEIGGAPDLDAVDALEVAIACCYVIDAVPLQECKVQGVVGQQAVCLTQPVGANDVPMENRSYPDSHLGDAASIAAIPGQGPNKIRFLLELPQSVPWLDPVMLHHFSYHPPVAYFREDNSGSKAQQASIFDREEEFGAVR